MNLSKVFTLREKVLLVILALLMVFAAYYLAVFRPTTETLNAIRLQQVDADAKVLVLEAQSAALEQMRAELESILSDPRAVEIPVHNNLQKLMAFLNTTLAPTTDYDLSFQAPQLPAEEGGGGAIVRRGLTMTFFCSSYAQARSVINQLHDGPYRCQVQNLSIDPADSAGRSPKNAAAANIESLPVQVTISTMYYEILE